APTPDPEAIPLLHSAVALLEGWGIRLHLSLCYALLADALVRSGDDDGALAAAEKALARARDHDRLGGVAALRAAAVAHAHRDGDLGRADACLEEASRAAASKRSPREAALIDLARGEILAAAGRPGEAAPLVEQARAAFVDLEMPFYADLAARVAGSLPGSPPA